MAAPIPPDAARADSVIDQARNLARTIVNRQVSKRLVEAANGMASLSGTVREIGVEVQKRQPSEAFSNVTLTLVERIDAVAAYLEHAEPERVYADAKRFSGERPAIAAFAALSVGFGVARVIRASAASGA